LFDDFVTSYEIAVPTTKILEKFNKSVSPLFSTIIKNKQESSNLAQLRDFLLPLLMNGQITISEEQNKPIIAPFRLFADDDTDFQTWKEQIGLAARGGIDEKTLRNIYEAIDENDR
jgi:hypothetical protein